MLSISLGYIKKYMNSNNAGTKYIRTSWKGWGRGQLDQKRLLGKKRDNKHFSRREFNYYKVTPVRYLFQSSINLSI